MSSTPLACRPARLRRHSIGYAQPITGPLSTGVVRVDARMLARVSPKIVFTREDPPAGTRRGIYGCKRLHGAQAEVFVLAYMRPLRPTTV